MSVVLDSSAVLALLWEEEGAEKVACVMDTAVISSVNAAEVVAKLVDRGFDPDEASEIFLNIALKIIDFDLEMALLSGQLRYETKSIGLSLGDRACIALGLVHNTEIYTADKVWSTLDSDNYIQLIR